MYFRERSQAVLHRSAFIFVLSAALAFGAGSSLAQQPLAADRPASLTPHALSETFAEVVKKVEPAVVSISTKGKMPEITAKSDTPKSDPGDIMDFFRKQLPRRPVYAIGSGFIVDRSGYIVTNAHVIEEASRITVKLDDGQEFTARVIGSDDETDLAVLKIDAGRDLPFVDLGNSDSAKVGEWVLAIGSPFGLSRTVTAGIISQTKRETPQATAFQRFIQTDAAINKGNSGGPLVNLKGEVIGVNSQIATSTGDYNGVGFALPSNEVATVYKQILDNGRVRRGFLGVTLETVKQEFAKVYGLGDAKGAIVIDIRDKQSPAARAGLQIGDVITTVNGMRVDNANDLITRVSSTTPGETVTVEYVRESGATVEKRLTQIRLGERDDAVRSSLADDGSRRKLPLDGTSVKQEQQPFGLTLSELTPALAASYKLEGMKGILVKDVNPESYIADVKVSNGTDALSEGDLIRRINRVTVTDLKTFNSLVGKLKTGDAVVMEVVSYNPVNRAPQLKIVQFTVQ
ncbi:MAG: Do family serine endopeptidase [Pyrinomonadaceae bacterium]